MTNTAKKQGNQMWGGRFKASPDTIMEKINVSIDFDKRLYKQDIAGSKAHCAMLVAQKILTKEEGKSIQGGLDDVQMEIEQGTFPFRKELEDIHMNIEGRLKELIGDVAGKLHTGRSRNDQVATDLRLWVMEACDALVDDMTSLQAALSAQAALHENTIMPGFTHLQTAQPVTLAMHLMAYHAMLERDITRMQDARKRTAQSPLGAAALAGTSFPVDRNMTAKNLGFNGVMHNTLDAVSARDFVLEFLSASAICGMHLSRLAEEIVLWSTPQFGFIRLSDSYSTGSSIMPQKRNPDAAELVRAKTGALNGNLIQLLTVMKALPLAYNKDMQEDKQPVFDSFDTVQLCLQAMTGMVSTWTVQIETMTKAAQSGFSTATDLADWLVKNLKMPFREAHHVTGALVKMSEEKGCRLDELTLQDMQLVNPSITENVYKALSVEESVKGRQK